MLKISPPLTDFAIKLNTFLKEGWLSPGTKYHLSAKSVGRSRGGKKPSSPPQPSANCRNCRNCRNCCTGKEPPPSASWRSTPPGQQVRNWPGGEIRAQYVILENNRKSLPRTFPSCPTAGGIGGVRLQRGVVIVAES